MAIKRNVKKIRLQLQFDNGTDGEKQLLIKRNYGYIPTNVPDENIYNVGATLADMGEKPLFAVGRTEEALLESL